MWLDDWHKPTLPALAARAIARQSEKVWGRRESTVCYRGGRYRRSCRRSCTRIAQRTPIAAWRDAGEARKRGSKGWGTDLWVEGWMEGPTKWMAR
jgi:hypothetical protein